MHYKEKYNLNTHLKVKKYFLKWPIIQHYYLLRIGKMWSQYSFSDKKVSSPHGPSDNQWIFSRKQKDFYWNIQVFLNMMLMTGTLRHLSLKEMQDIVIKRFKRKYGVKLKTSYFKNHEKNINLFLFKSIDKLSLFFLFYWFLSKFDFIVEHAYFFFI